MEPAETSYQQSLRSLGLWLDQHHVCSVNVIEVDTGFVTRCELRQITVERVEEFVPRDSERLRSLAATLDEFFARGGIFTEVQGGFVVRYPREQARIEMEEHSFSHEELHAMAPSHAARRGRAESSTEGGGVLGGEPGGYQNIFRAIGRELDELRSYFVLLGEADRELLITYQMLDPHRNYLPLKRMAILGPEARETMRDDARARRDQPRRGRAWGWL